MALITQSVVSVEELGASLDDPNLAVIEVHAKAPDQPLIPGARVAFWKDLAWHPLERELATGEELSERLFRLGAGEGSRIVLAGDPTQFAAYLLWTLRVRGYTDIAYLDGGLEAWRASGSPTAADHTVDRVAPTAPLPVPEPTSEQERLRIGRDEVRALLGRDDVVILDYRTPEEYCGARVSGPKAPIDHGAERHGRIPGARHLFFRDLLDEHGALRAARRAAAAGRREGARHDGSHHQLLPTVAPLDAGLDRAVRSARHRQRPSVRRLVDRMGKHRRLPVVER